MGAFRTQPALRARSSSLRSDTSYREVLQIIGTRESALSTANSFSSLHQPRRKSPEGWMTWRAGQEWVEPHTSTSASGQRRPLGELYSVWGLGWAVVPLLC